MILTDVSKTAVATLRCHVLESRKKKPIIKDPMAEYCLDKLSSLASDEDRSGIFQKRLSPMLINHIVIRARKYDNIINDFVAKNPDCTVINLGCGFDTRYWRIDCTKCTFYDLDLHEVIEVKREILKDKPEYEMIGSSVLDASWIEKISSKRNRNVLLVAEGLFMYLPRPDVINLFRTLAANFYNSQIVLEVVTDKYTRGIWKKIVTYKIRRELGLDAGSSYHFGIAKATEIETFAEGIKVIDEWSYVEDPDTRPRLLKYLGISRTQWTVRATINENK
ncbi:MAG: class I SAM-dependent methyltransferase [Bacteroidales bacterium]|nr:class I SAM-dependent methyltransferase [Bacteroidales bacterium]